MTRVLFVDDSEKRIQRFKEKADDSFNVIYAKTAQDAIQALEKEALFNTVHLDHDLGGKQFQSSLEENCGMAVVRWIINNRPHIIHIFVHTWNIPAGREMVAKLKDAGYTVTFRPFEISGV